MSATLHGNMATSSLSTKDASADATYEDGQKPGTLPQYSACADLKNSNRSEYSTANPIPDEVNPSGHFRSPCAIWVAGGICFALVLALAGVTGGLGAALVEAKRSCNVPWAATSTAVMIPASSAAVGGPTSTAVAPSPIGTISNYFAPSPATISSLYLDCPALDGQPYSSFGNVQFTQHCGIDYAEAIGVRNIQGIIVYHVQDCIDACAFLNSFSALEGGERCNGISFSNNMGYDYQRYNANCWLKNATWAGTSANGYLSASMDNTFTR